MRFLGHSTARLELAGRVVLTDPVLTGRVGPLRRTAAPVDPADHAGVDLVLLSHLHADHLHLPSLRRLTGARIVVPRGAGEWLRGKGIARVEELGIGEELVDGGLRVTGVEAAHSGHRWGPRSTRGPQARAMGHLVEADGLTVYVSGDTDLFDAMADLPRPDVALLPVWGWGPSLGPGHLDPVRAAEAVALLRPRVAVPVHWGTLALPGLTRAPGARGENMRRLLVEPPREFAAAVAAAGVGTHVALTEPGERVALPPLPVQR
ncbi:MBL fold metallo-hydrolase [Pseudonocardia sp. KRD-184]|uniref:MBL fold metallo-hydrolase n=5 Tax=Pseudonocardia oceani TaxID=2792013 RepID=A0ABS6UCT7_9PSEU|nr:MBL fold metallo-hydrolase [Pseudonocardia oceani]MBW0094423.1 MBL fold metallo-hydrolase [Pseudonocardia oceani]MBW0119970.1 MBL fold metallo-hydrolase [Pseudonocardia oceani]MBW0130050.1 MBL fold metallo-hydrolase [Pseudonocardia oceani]